MTIIGMTLTLKQIDTGQVPQFLSVSSFAIRKHLENQCRHRGMSYLKLGWNWVRLAITEQWNIQVYPFLSSLPDPQPAIACKRQHNYSLNREFTVLRSIPAS